MPSRGKKSATRGVEASVEDSEVTATAQPSSSFLFKNKDAPSGGDDDAEDTPEERAERLANKQKVIELENEERVRRMSEIKEREDEAEIVRQINIEYSISAEEEERQRRVHELEMTKVEEQLLRTRNQALAANAAEGERQRRMSEVEEDQAKERLERRQSRGIAIEAMETERMRRISAPANTSDVLAGDEGILSDIQVLQSPASKILIDEHSEWRCFMLSDNPDKEKDDLRAIRISLEDELQGCSYPELVGDVRLLRFLREYDGDVSIAATKFREMLAFREEHKLDAIREHIISKNLTPKEFPAYNKVIQYWPSLTTFDLVDVNGENAFYFDMPGYADIRGMLHDVTEEEWMEYILYEMEYRAIKLDELSRRNEKMVQVVVVRDLSGFSLLRFSTKMPFLMTKLRTVVMTAYPHTIRRVLLLNMPKIVHKIWHTIMQSMNQLQMLPFAMNSDAWAQLIELVGSREKLPKLMGGKNPDLVIPQTGFLGRDSFVQLCEDGATWADIKAGNTLQVPFRMAANDTICWEFEVKAHNIAFSVKMRTQGDGGAQEVEKVETARYSAGQTIAGTYTATEDGTAVLSWDNSYSWMSGKTVAYKASVVKATQTMETDDGSV